MIRIVSRRLIIPRGDTGEFSVPLLPSTSSSPKIAVFSILDLLNQKLIYQHEASISDNKITVHFEQEDTISLPIGQYVWDIKTYTNPQYKDNKLINGDEVDSYYAGFSYPVCEVTVTRDRNKGG